MPFTKQGFPPFPNSVSFLCFLRETQSNQETKTSSMNQNQNLHERVNVGLQGFRAALELLAESLQMIADGVNHLEAEPLHGANIDINQPVTLAAIRACMGSIEQLGIRIRGAVDDINFFIPTQPDVRPNFPAQIRVITVAMRMMGSSALAIHGFLVHNSFGRRETLGGVYYRIQLGLAHLNMALLEFQTNISILRSLEPQGFIWDDLQYDYDRDVVQ